MYPAIFWDYRLLLGVNVRSEVPWNFRPKLASKNASSVGGNMAAKVPGSFGAPIASKGVPNIAGNVGASLPASGF